MGTKQPINISRCNACPNAPGGSFLRSGGTNSEHLGDLNVVPMEHAITLAFALTAFVSQAQITHEIHIMDDEFSPPTLIINLNDHVHLIWDDNDHTFTQVSLATWNANGDTPLAGGYQYGLGTPNPTTDVTITPTATGTIYYVCEFHVSNGMKGQIIVQGLIGMDEVEAPDQYSLMFNAATSSVQLAAPDEAPVQVELYDATGRQRVNERMSQTRSLDLEALPTGLYLAYLRDMSGRPLAWQRLYIVR